MLPYSLEEAAKSAAGNWKEFDNFGWDRKYDEGSEDLFLYYPEHRDSTILEHSNSETIQKIMFEDNDFGDDVWSEEHGHWGVGWAKCLVVRVYDSNREITPAFTQLYEIMSALANYPVLDEEDYCQREYDETISNIELNAPTEMFQNLPDDWANQVFTYLLDIDIYADGPEYWYEKKDIQEAMVELGFEKDLRMWGEEKDD